jgi:hypothetical protein
LKSQTSVWGSMLTSKCPLWSFDRKYQKDQKQETAWTSRSRMAPDNGWEENHSAP